MRVERIGSATLYNGDCLEVIPTLKDITSVVTDPPYGTEEIVGGYSRSGATIANDKDLKTCMYALQATCRVAPAAVWAVFYSPRVRREFFATLPPELHDLAEIIWDKKAPGMGRGVRYQHENVALFYTGDEKKVTRDVFSVMRDYRSAETHPHQKPISLITTLCELVGGKITLDPFMGSGTTGVACAAIGRPFVGVELDPGHFDTCCRRVQDAHNRPRLFAEQANDNAPVAIDMFGAA
jgi:site-specific DNA-methyltransferase (adenine-specific)